MNEISRGLCQCGCGGRTNVITMTSTKRGYVKGEFYDFIAGHNSDSGFSKGYTPWNKGSKNGECPANWKGGKTTTKAGYVRVWIPEEQRYEFEHVLIATRVLGKPLPPEARVHHWDENPTNNEPSNLVICENNSYHLELHHRKKAMAACGDPNKYQCWICGIWDNTANMVRESRSYVHHECLKPYRVRHDNRPRKTERRKSPEGLWVYPSK